MIPPLPSYIPLPTTKLKKEEEKQLATVEMMAAGDTNTNSATCNSASSNVSGKPGQHTSPAGKSIRQQVKYLQKDTEETDYHCHRVENKKG